VSPLHPAEPEDRFHCIPLCNGERPCREAANPTARHTLRGTATAEALQVIVDVDLDTLAAIEPPRGYRRD
jgi:hypothetical protein